MAGLKKPVKKREPGKTSTGLVLFLVFFILVAIGLGVWGYYGYAGQEELRTKAKSEAATAKAAKLAEEYWEYVANDTRLALGFQLDADELTRTGGARAEFLNDAGKFKDFKSRETIKKMIEENTKALGYAEADKKYAETFKALNKKESDKAMAAFGASDKAQAEQKDLDAKVAKNEKQEEKRYKDHVASIAKGSAAALAASQARSAEFEAQLKRNQELEDQIKAEREKLDDAKTKFAFQIKALQREIDKASASNAEPVATATNRGSGEQHALLLDISRGKPLWDNPLGKITRVDLEGRQVYINLGSNHGVKPELSFNVFGAGWNGRAEKQLKGTLEVIRVVDENTAIARITTLYDSTGQEIVLTDPVLGRPMRESENALKEGDLLFNMFWGTHVAIAGNIPFGGVSDNPAEQMRNLSNFVYFLQRQGVTVDAYLDLTDGQLKGAITSKTRYLIRGIDPGTKPGKEAAPAPKIAPEPKAEPKAAPAPKKDADDEKKDEKKDEEKKDEEKVDEAPKEAGEVPENVKTVRQAADAMRKEAIDKGLLIISFDNFLGVIGYRQPRSALSQQSTGFRPSLIFAGSPTRGAEPAAPKKDAEPKNGDPEK